MSKRCAKKQETRRVGNFQQLTTMFVVCFTLCLMLVAKATVIIYPTPSDSSVSGSRFSVKVNNTSTAVYDFFDQYTYNWATTAEPHFTAFTTDENVTITVTTTFDFTNYTIRPLGKSISASKSGRTLTFTMPTSARQLVVEFDGDAKKPLLLFSNPPDPTAPSYASSTYTDFNKKIFYYGPGVHNVNLGWLFGPDYDGWTVYIAGGAIVKGDIQAAPANFTVKGPGIWAALSGSGTPVRLSGNNFTMKDTVLVNRRDEWAVQVVGVSDAMFDNVKILAEIRDGWDVVNGQRATLKNSFVMAHDDAVSIKGVWHGNNEDVDTVLVENCVMSNIAGGQGLVVGGEADAPNFKNITFRNIDLIHNLPNETDAYIHSVWPEAALTMVIDGPALTTNTTFEDIRIEDNQDEYLFDFRFGGNATNDINGVTVKNVRVVAGPWRPSRITGKSSAVRVRNVSFINLRKPDGTVITSAGQGNFTINQYTENITFSSGAIANLLWNSSFESEQYNTQTPSHWSEWSGWPVGTHYEAGYTENYGGSKSGNYHGTHWKGSSAYNIYTFQQKTGLTNGLYTLRAWVKGSGGQTEATMLAKNFGGNQVSVNIPASSTYTQITLPNINVTNGQCEVGFWSNANAGQWIYFDDVEFFKQ